MRRSGRLPPPLKTPAARPPRAPAALPGVPGRRSQVGVASVCPSHRQGARSAQEAPNPGPDSPPQTPLTCLHGPVGAPESRAERLSSAAAAAAKPQFPQGIDSSGWRWRGGGKEPEEAKEEGGFRRDPGARVGAGALGEGEKENHPGSGLSRQREAGTGRMGEVGGEGPPGATEWRPLPEDQRRSEEERSNLPPDCARRARRARRARPGEKKLGRTFRGRESQSGRKCERPREEGGRGRASGRGRSRRQRPRLPHPRAGLGGAGGSAGRAPGAGRNAAGRARAGARGVARKGEPQLPSPRRASLGTSQRWNPRNAGLQELLLQARGKSRTFNVVALEKVFKGEGRAGRTG